MLLKLDKFGGMAPKYQPRILPEPFAQQATDCLLEHKQLRSAYGLGAPYVTPVGGENLTLGVSTQTAHLYRPYQQNESVILWNDRVDVVARPIPNDEHNRIYWTSETSEPRFTTDDRLAIGQPADGEYFKLGIPAPTQAPTILISEEDPDNPVDKEDISIDKFEYVYTYTVVDSYGQESAPFTPLVGDFDTYTVWAGQYVTISNLPLNIGGGQSGYNETQALIRIYRAGLGGQFQRIAELNMGTTSFEDHHEDGTLVLESSEWEPPHQDMQNLVLHPAGFMLGSLDYTLMVSERYVFHGWSSLNQRVCPHKIRALVPYADGVVALTEGPPYMVQGNDPAALTLVPLEGAYPCVNKHSVADVHGMILYATNAGVALLSGGAAALMTDPVLDRIQWQAYNPETGFGYSHDGKYIYCTGAKSLVFDFSQQPVAMTEASYSYDVGVYDHRTDRSLFKNASRQLCPLEHGASGVYTWHSREWVFPVPLSFGAVKFSADSYADIRLDVYADDVLVQSINHSQLTLEDGAAYGRLVKAPRAKRYSLRLTGSDNLDFVALATSFAELANE